MKRREMEQSPEEGFFRERKERYYQEVPEELDRAVLDYSRKNLVQKRFSFHLPEKFRAVAAILILALPITAVFLMESGSGESVRVKQIAKTVRKSAPATTLSRMDIADMELYQLNSELELVQNVLAYSAREKQREKVNF